jgi:hypothetical protein
MSDMEFVVPGVVFSGGGQNDIDLRNQVEASIIVLLGD